jgi:hypothetical protein
MYKRAILLVFLLSAAYGADKLTAPQLIDLAKSNGPALQEGIAATFDAKDLKEGTAWVGRGPDFFFAVESATEPLLFIDDAAGPKMRAVSGGKQLWYAAASIPQLGKLHSFYYLVNGAKFGGRPDLPAFGPLSYLDANTPLGTLLGPMSHTSKIYDGMKSEYWVYVPAQYDPKSPAALMVFQDGGGYIKRDGNNPSLNVIDNLIAQKKIPV